MMGQPRADFDLLLEVGFIVHPGTEPSLIQFGII